jgi:N-acetylmuramoyl-L-alanine amidase
VEIIQKLLTVNKYSRPGTLLKVVSGIVVHWVGNPRSTALENRSYFEGLKDQGDTVKEKTYASAHFIVGLDGEVIQCVPENETAYHVGAERHLYKAEALRRLDTAYPNNCTLGIELCHPDWTGKFNTATLRSAAELAGALLERHHLTDRDVYRHFDITGKECPLYFVRNEDEWKKFIERTG